jgi:hypothetical protein
MKLPSRLEGLHGRFGHSDTIPGLSHDVDDGLLATLRLFRRRDETLHGAVRAVRALLTLLEMSVVPSLTCCYPSDLLG